MWDSLIAVGGTLAGSLVVGVVQLRAARASRWAEREAREDDRREQRRAEIRDAVTALVAALADHRRAGWVRADARLTGKSAAAREAARVDSHVTRSAVTAPLVTLLVLAPSLAEAVNEAKAAAFALHDSPDEETLKARRQASVDANDRLIAAAGEFFAALGATVDPYDTKS